MNNKPINIDAISQVAKAWGHLKDQMGFGGGAVAALYADGAPDLELRETDDIDLTSVELIDYNKYSQLLEKLAQLGFHPDPEGHAICSLKFKDISVDIMPSEDGPLGPANKWYSLGFDDLWTSMAGEEEIKILSSPVTWRQNLKPSMTGEKITGPVMTLKISYLCSIIEIHW
ncbi:MAG: hypothetical protein PF450_13370 [Bacteroidales bacterium]|jgi:hypothetical protein|nr:hypothetical protein [Bacteroidales bacterium]